MIQNFTPFFLLNLGGTLLTLMVVLKLALSAKAARNNQLQNTAAALKKIQATAIENNTRLLTDLEHVFRRHYRDVGQDMIAVHKTFLKKIEQSLQAELAQLPSALKTHTQEAVASATKDIETWKTAQIAKYEQKSAAAMKELVKSSLALHLNQDQHHQLVKTALENAWNEGALHDK